MMTKGQSGYSTAMHQITTVNPSTCNNAIQSVFWPPPSTYKPQRRPHRDHVTRKRYRVNPAPEHLGTNKLPHLSQFKPTTHNQPTMSER